MAEELRAGSGSNNATASAVTTVFGVGTTQSADVECGCPEPGPEKIEVEQVLGAEMEQRVVEFDMVVPARKPDIEQIIDVYVKDVEITSVDVITDKVIVRGELAVKVMYVADLPSQPVHAFEKSHIRFTRDIVIDGAQTGMKATADVIVEFVDYDFNEDDNRTIHITIVLKMWARVVNTTEMDVYALGVVDQVGQVESTTASGSKSDMVAASQFSDTSVSATESASGKISVVSPEPVVVSGPEVTPTAGVSQAVSGSATVTGNAVNVRTGPGTNFPVVTKVNKGDIVTIKDQAFGWYKVLLADGVTSGWIASWLVSNPAAGAPAAPKG